MKAASSGGTDTTKAARRNMPLADLVHRCSEAGETQDDYRHELFRRAICELDEQAWQAVVDQFRGVVLANVKRHPWTAARNEDGYWINRVFERFWRAIGPDRFESFADLPSLLAYLKTCVHSVVVNDVRSFRRGPAEVPLEEAIEKSGDPAGVEATVLDALSVRDLWTVVEEELSDADERLIVHMSFVLDMKPAEIQALQAQRFPTMADLYRVKRSAVDRLRRSSRLRRFME
jgi:hypothetical protein